MLLNQTENRDGETMVISGKCTMCKKPQSIRVDARAYLRYANGTMLIQEALPMLGADSREMLISGTCPECWNDLFGKDD